MKIKEFLNNYKQKERPPEERKKRAIVELSIYAVLFVIIIIFSQINKNDQKINENPNDNIKENITIEDKLEKLTNNNFDSIINISNDKEEFIVEIRRESKEKEIISKNNIENYVLIENKYYKIDLDNSNIELVDNPNIYKEYDTTFLDIDNIVELINTTNKTDLKEEYYLIARYKVNINDVLNIYNRINNTNYTSSDESQIIINVNYNSNIEAINLDLTNLYNIIKPNSYNKIYYDISYKLIGEIDLKELKVPE